jgi:hypothetical protein
MTYLITESHHVVPEQDGERNEPHALKVVVTSSLQRVYPKLTFVLNLPAQ